jgi:hypothetical protein
MCIIILLAPMRTCISKQLATTPSQLLNITGQLRPCCPAHRYESEGMRRSVEGVVLVQQHGHPHLLLLSSTQGTMYKLPGGRLKVGEDGEAPASLRQQLVDTTPCWAEGPR